MKKSLPGIFIAILFIAVIVTGCKKDPVTKYFPTVGTTNIISEATATSAISGGVDPYFTSSTDVTLANGVCWSSTNQVPTIADSKTTDSLSAVFSSKLTNLTPSTTYYVRAYVTSTVGTGYGGVVSFKTASATASTSIAVTTLAGSTSGAFGYADALGTSALFDGPQSVIFNAATGKLYVADVINNVLRTITPAGNVGTLTNPTLGYTDGPLATAQFYGPGATAVDAAGNTYVSDAGNNVIRKITPAGVVSTLAGNGTPGYADGTGAIVKFNSPQGLAVDATGNIYVADRGNNVIRKITPTGTVSTYAGVTTPGLFDAAAGSTAQFNAPVSVAVDASGNVYVADLKNRAIRKIAPTGAVATIAGGLIYPFLIGAPNGLAFDAAGNLYIADQSGRILKLVQDKILYTVAGSTTPGYVNGAGAAARFNTPQSLTFDAAGNLYVADFGNNAIRKIAITTTP
jgi:sugar lactone lactonase YvrE